MRTEPFSMTTTTTPLNTPPTPLRAPTEERADILSRGIAPFYKELFLLDPLDLAFYMHGEQWISLGDLLHSAIELFFQPNTLMFSYGGSVALTWHAPIAFSFDMEFRNLGIEASFRLFVPHPGYSDPKEAPSVQIMRLFFSQASQNPKENTLRLAHSLKQARLV